MLLQVSSDLSIIYVDVAFKITLALGTTMITYFIFLILAVFTWPVLFLIVPMIYLTLIIQVIYMHKVLSDLYTHFVMFACHLPSQIPSTFHSYCRNITMLLRLS